MVIKRDGTSVNFDSSKIKSAITKANNDVKEMTPEDIIKITEAVVAKCSKIEDIDVEQIQDIVEKTLLTSKFKATAKHYILYRDQRTRIREGKMKMMREISEMVEGKNDYWNKENSNKDATVVTTQRDYLAGITSTEISKNILLPQDVREAHLAGIIHEHDMDYLAQKALHNCCLINLEDILQNGTTINGVKIDPQHRLLTAATVATQVITAVASSQYGGTTITLTHLAPFVRNSFFRYFKDGLTYLVECDPAGIIDNFKLTKDTPLSNDDYKRYPAVYKYAMDMLKREIRDAVQTFNYQINSMSTTNGWL